MPQAPGTTAVGMFQRSEATITNDHVSRALTAVSLQWSRAPKSEMECEEALGEVPSCLFSCLWLHYPLVIATPLSCLQTASNLPPLHLPQSHLWLQMTWIGSGNQDEICV